MKRTAVVTAVSCAVIFVAGCCTTPRCPRAAFRNIVLPIWFTQPSGVERMYVPVNGNIKLPPNLDALADEYGLPRWTVYGVVRGLGAEEFLANGVFKTFTIFDEMGESSVTVDEVHYDVEPNRVRAVLAKIVRDCVAAESELDRQRVLGRYIHRRFGSFLLFGLAQRPPDAENLLMTSGVSTDPMETFTVEQSAALPVVGWRETPTEYIETHAGPYAYGHPLQAFRRTEEEAIRELAKSLMVKFSHLRKELGRQSNDGGDYQEDAIREEVKLRMRGVVVLRRAVDVDRGLCLVQVAVPTQGVAGR
jgi:hypothetical protein